MRVDQLRPCPFCGIRPERHESVGPSGYTWSTEEEKIFSVACMITNCPPSGIYLPDLVWNVDSHTQNGLMESIFSTMEAEKSQAIDEKRDCYNSYLKRHE